MRDKTDVSADGVRIAYSDLRHLAVTAVFAKWHLVKEVVNDLEPDLISTKDTVALRNWTQKASIRLACCKDLLGEFRRALDTANAIFYGEARDKVEIIQPLKKEE